jgi:hypothetical protein
MTDYSEIVEDWVREFILTMDDGIIRPGNESGDSPLGVKIIFDGYGYNEETNENDDYDSMSFAVFVHKDSLNGEEFPEHDQTPWALVHRPSEEVCIYVWYDVKNDSVDVLPFEDGDTELDHEFVYELIDKLSKNQYLND